MDVSGPVLLFDGECGLCVRCVRLLLASDRRGRLRFAPLQGEAAQSFLRERGLPTEDFDSAIFAPDWAKRVEAAPLYRTDALFAAMHAVGGGWRWMTWVQVLPGAWRDAAYRWVARGRRRFFGRGDVSTLYAEFGRERFLR
jgi:predicted DCC family thiol-disulfide oxidoreductase YuxK